jgi:membrane fusion protein (multidrug efflux system)
VNAEYRTTPAADASRSSTPADKTESPPTPADSTGRRQPLLITLAIILVVAAGIWWIWARFVSGGTESTENAYTAADVAQVTPLVSGAVKTITVTDTEFVKAGQIVLTIDDTDARIAVESAEANLAQTQRQVEQLLANDENLAGQIDTRDADIISAEADLQSIEALRDKAKIDAERRRPLAAPGAVSREELADSELALRQASAAVVQAQGRLAAAEAGRKSARGAREANAALMRNTTIENNPTVRAARAKLDQARIDLDRTVVKAPSDGVVDQRDVDVGQRVAPGQRLMIVVPTDRIYVNANFKEGQLRAVQPGQRVKMTADLYGDHIVYHGRVVGFAGGSGSAFSAIPAQNATGNWIKVVQRLPVRIELDAKELHDNPLRVGLSMHAIVDLDSTPGNRRHE